MYVLTHRAQDAALKTTKTLRNDLEASWLRSCSAITKLQYTAARFAEIQPVEPDAYAERASIAYVNISHAWFSNKWPTDSFRARRTVGAGHHGRRGSCPRIAARDSHELDDYQPAITHGMRASKM
eukprot:COSAG05_NODE_711_length_7822_cov_11.919720_12_plen_125_part_00